LSEVFLLSRRFWFVPLLAWLLIVLWSLIANINSIIDHNLEVARNSAQNIFRIVQLTRYWNARHGGVYVPVSEFAQPNPYLKVPRRDVITRDNVKLTMINPAYMTRQLTELLEQDSEVSFHITSLNPLRPQNRADAWEHQALQRFEQGVEEYYERLSDSGHEQFRFMAPLFVKQPCLKCHAEQGYKLGDIRGGISVTLDANYIFDKQTGVIAYEIAKHGVVFVIFSAMFWLFLDRMRRHWVELIQVKQRQEVMIEERTRELRELATRDPLTGLFNRKALNDYLDKELQRSARYDHSLVVFVLDIDHFKEINDRYSHRSGDAVLKKLAKILLEGIRNTDFAARYGGEEFVIILPETTLPVAMSLAQRLRENVENMQIPMEDGNVMQISTSIGIAVYPAHARSAGELIHRADTAMYRAKREGRNRVCVAG